MTTENLEGLLEGYYLGCGSLPPQDLIRNELEVEAENQPETPPTLRSEPPPLETHTTRRIRNHPIRRRGYFRHSK